MMRLESQVGFCYKNNMQTCIGKVFTRSELPVKVHAMEPLSIA